MSLGHKIAKSCTVSFSYYRIKALTFISYKWLLTRRLYEPLLHFTWVFISFRVLNPGVYLGPGIYMSPASIQINTVCSHFNNNIWTPLSFIESRGYHADWYRLTSEVLLIDNNSTANQEAFTSGLSITSHQQWLFIMSHCLSESRLPPLAIFIHVIRNHAESWDDYLIPNSISYCQIRI